MGKTNPCWTKNPTLGCRILNYPTDPDMRLAHNLVRGGPFPYPFTFGVRSREWKLEASFPRERCHPCTPPPTFTTMTLQRISIARKKFLVGPHTEETRGEAVKG